jgi:RNA 2',3'-cyclic 3'-phosphodiesterase
MVGCNPIHSLFCALRPPKDLARDLWEEFDWLGARDDRVEPERFHVTLVRLGAWPHHPDSVIARAQGVCASLDATAFRIVLDNLIVGDRVLLKPSEAVPALDRFQRRLAGELAKAGLVRARGCRFNPHMTASYRTRAHGDVFLPPVSWMVREFVLIESLIGHRRQIERGRWGLHE